MKLVYNGVELEEATYTEVNTKTGVLHVTAPEAAAPDEDGPEPDVVIEPGP